MKDNIILNKIYKVLKLILIILCSMLIVLSVGVSSYINNNKTSEESESEYNTEYDVSSFLEIKASDIKNRTKDLSVLYIGRSTCGWCVRFLPNLLQAQSEFDYKTLYIDIAKIIDFENNKISDEEAYNIMLNLTGDNYDGYMKENFGSTPMILIMKNGKIINAQSGYSEYDDFKEFLNKSGIK